ncbi:MAG: heavy metal-binding domain-containing protein [Endomicrobiales bacterium]
MRRAGLAVAGMVLALGLVIKPAWAMSCHGGGEMNHDKQQSADKKAEMESFTETVYSCPMHPEVRSDQPGKCPNCGMDLEAKQAVKYRLKKDHSVERSKADQNGKAVVQEEPQNNALSSCPMHSKAQSDKPGKSPKCGMDLEKQDEQGKAADKQCHEMGNDPQCDMASDEKQAVKKEAAPKKAASTQSQKGAGSAAYQCPMHPGVTSDKPGKCAKCGMFLEKK